jgi:nicotinate-nucleotide adenylyltransferase
MRELGLDEVVWVPANRNPLKHTRQSSPNRRLEMCKRAVDGHPGMAVSDIEVSRGGDSYLVDTLEELKIVMPGEYWFIVGMDAVASFAQWKKPERILQLCRLAVFARPGIDSETALGRLGIDLSESIDLIAAPPLAVSSSNIRDMVQQGQDFAHLVEPSIYEYIKKNGLYAD